MNDPTERMTDAEQYRDEEHPQDRLQRERVGVSGDPVPDADYGDDADTAPPHEARGGYSRPCVADDCDGMMHVSRNKVRYDCEECDEWMPVASASWEDNVTASTADEARALASPGLLTLKQALAYVLRDVEGLGRPQTAAIMGVSESTQDSHIAEARKKVGKARAVADVAEDLRGVEETRCDGCGQLHDPEDVTEHRPAQRAYTVEYCDACEDHRERQGVRPEDHEQYKLRDADE